MAFGTESDGSKPNHNVFQVTIACYHETENTPENLEIEFPQGVKYTITTAISDRPSSELLQDFARSGAAGLVNRIRTLENKGVLKP